MGVSKSEIDTTQCCICFLNKRSTIDSGIFIDVIFFTENYLNLIIRVATSGLDSVLQQTISVNNEPSGGIMSINGLKRLSQCWQNLEKKWASGACVDRRSLYSLAGTDFIYHLFHSNFPWPLRTYSFHHTGRINRFCKCCCSGLCCIYCSRNCFILPGHRT